MRLTGNIAASISVEQESVAGRTTKLRAVERRLRFARSPVSPQQEHDPGDDHRQRQPLPHRETERERAEKIVGLACVFGEEAERAIAEQKESGDRTDRAPPSRINPQHDEEQNALERELVELRR